MLLNVVALGKSIYMDMVTRLIPFSAKGGCGTIIKQLYTVGHTQIVIQNQRLQNY